MGLSTRRLMMPLTTAAMTRLAPASERKANSAIDGQTPVKYSTAATHPAAASESVITPNTIAA